MTEEKKSGNKSKNYNGVEVYQCCCNMNKRNGLARFQSGIWKLICIRRDGEKERYHLCNEMNKIHIYCSKLMGHRDGRKNFQTLNQYT
jgi:hypothetical protein